MREGAPRRDDSEPLKVPGLCANCEARDVSFCAALGDCELKVLADLAVVSTVPAGELIFLEGDPALQVFNVTGGLIRAYKLTPDGRRQVTAFLFPGDFLGLNVEDRYVYSAEAIGETRVCRFDRPRLTRIFEQHRQLEHRFLGMMATELARAQDRMLLLGRKTAAEKLASFLLWLEEREHEPKVLHVPMSRADIADYLGLTLETVSRTFSRFAKEGLIRSDSPHRLELSDREALELLAEGND